MKKINIGLILIIIAIISVTIYSANEEKVRNEDRKNVEAICSEYLNLHSKFFMLEEEYRDINKVISKEEYNKYLDKVKKEISEYVIPEKVDYTLQKYKKVLDEQLDGRYILKSCDRKINQILSYNSDGTYVSMILFVDVSIEKDNRILPEDNEISNIYDIKVTSSKFTEKIVNCMILKKIGNEYKVVEDTADIHPSEYIPNNNFPDDFFKELY